MPPEVSLSPSFNAYSDGKLAEIAARVVEEFDSDGFYGELYCETTEGEDSKVADEEFEFSFVRSDSDLLNPIAADEVFRNGEIRPVYPVFNRNLLSIGLIGGNDNKKNSVPDSVAKKGQKVRSPLRKLFMEERETTMTTTSSSSSEVDELDGVPEETYCVWRPKTAEEEEEEGRCKKSNSGGCYSKRWKLRDLLYRSHSDGRKENFVFLNQSKRENRKRIEETAADGGKMKPAAAEDDGGEKRRVYLAYK